MLDVFFLPLKFKKKHICAQFDFWFRIDLGLFFGFLRSWIGL